MGLDFHVRHDILDTFIDPLPSIKLVTIRKFQADKIGILHPPWILEHSSWNYLRIHPQLHIYDNGNYLTLWQSIATFITADWFEPNVHRYLINPEQF